jgi:WD repeat-containing protein 19
VGKVNNEALTNQMVDYLTGEVDNIPKDAIYTLQLYKVLGNIEQAVKIAITIATQEQELGNYKSSHQVLFEVFKSLKEEKHPIPYELSQKLMIIHSYNLAKRMMKLNDHVLAARLLCRVANFISLFPKHTVPILTSVVMECARCGLKAAAYQWSLTLMKPENRTQISDKYKKKIEDIARKPPKTSDDPEPTNPCPFCKNPILELDIDCSSCKNCIPFCIASGKHMVLNEWSCCPACKLPAILPELTRVIQSEPTCPMCEVAIDPTKLAKVPYRN